MLVKSINEGKQYFGLAFNRAKYTQIIPARAAIKPLIALVGELRYRQHRTVPEIH